MSTELDDLLNDKPPGNPEGGPPATPDDPNAKLGQLANENADLRRGLDSLRAELESMRGRQAQPPPAHDDDWEKWATGVVKDAGTDQDWLTDPAASVRKTLVKAGKEITSHVSKIAQQEAMNAAGAMRADMEFQSYFPDLMATDMGQEAVKRAITDVRSDPRFQQALSRPATRQRAFEMIARKAKGMLPGASEPGPEDNSPIPAPRKGVFAQPGGGRIGQFTERAGVPEDREQEVLKQMTDHVRGKR